MTNKSDKFVTLGGVQLTEEELRNFNSGDGGIDTINMDPGKPEKKDTEQQKISRKEILSRKDATGDLVGKAIGYNSELS